MDASVSTPNLAATALALLLLTDLLPASPAEAATGNMFRDSDNAAPATAPCRHRRHRP